MEYLKLSKFRKQLERKIGQRQQVLKDYKFVKEQIKDLKREIRISKEAQTIIQVVAKETQQELEYRIAEPVSLCLSSVFDDPYEFIVDFVIRREKTECDLLFGRRGMTLKPVDASGIGNVDVAGFGTRVAVWSLSSPRSRPVLILDEPFKHLKGIEQNILVIQMVKTISVQLGLQIVMVSDERVPLKEIEKGADRIFYTKLVNGVSEVTVL